MLVFFEVHTVILEEFFPAKEGTQPKASRRATERSNRDRGRRQYEKKNSSRSGNSGHKVQNLPVYKSRNVHGAGNRVEQKPFTAVKTKTPVQAPAKVSSAPRKGSRNSKKKKRISATARSTLPDIAGFKQNLENLYGGGGGSSTDTMPKKEAVKVGSLSQNKTAADMHNKLGALFGGDGSRGPPKQAQPQHERLELLFSSQPQRNVAPVPMTAKASTGSGMNKYEKMLQAGLPEGAVLNKMKMDGIKNPNISMIKSAKPKNNNTMEKALQSQKVQPVNSEIVSSRKKSSASSGGGISSWFFSRKKKSKKTQKSTHGSPKIESRSKPPPAKPMTMLDELNNRLVDRKIG